MALAVTGCSKENKKDSSATNVPTKVIRRTTVTFQYGINGGQRAELGRLTTGFKKKNPSIKIKFENQGSYIDLQAKVDSTLRSPSNLPTIIQAYPGWLYNAVKSSMLIDLSPYINNSKLGWGSTAKSNIRTGLLDGAKIQEKQYNIPFNKSVKVSTCNRSMFEKYGIRKVPMTMRELARVSETIYKKSGHRAVDAGLDSLANYHTLGMRNEGINLTDKVNFTGKDPKRAIDHHAQGMKKGYFTTVGSAHYLSSPFTNEKAAMHTGTSAGEGYVKEAVGDKFTYNVAACPSKYIMQQGTDIYMFKKTTAMRRTVTFKYMQSLISKSIQLKWANATGYIPVNNSVVKSREHKESTRTKLLAKLERAMKHSYSIPVARNSNVAYSQLDPIITKILYVAKNGQNTDNQIKAGKAKFDAARKQ